MDLKKIFKKIALVAKQENIPVYVVGGFVRDFLMDIPQKQDIDFVVVGRGLDFAKKLDVVMKQEGSLVEFPEFDTARYVLGEEEKQMIIEFAGARSEKYHTESRKPKVTGSSLEEDLSRRDFTVNAMAVPVQCFGGLKWPTKIKIKKELVDSFDGQVDLKNKILRTPLSPDQTFVDDPLRMMRAVRFAAQLNFGIEEKTLEGIHRNRKRLSIVSAERIKEELFKLLACPQPSIGCILMFQTSLLDVILPEVSALDGVEEIYGHQHKNNLIHTFKVVDNIAERSDKTLLRLAGLLHDIGKSSTKKFIPKVGWSFYQHEHVGRKLTNQIGRRLRFSNAETTYLSKLVRWHQQPISLMDEGITDSAVRRLIFNLGDELDDLLILGRSDITTGNPTKKVQRLKNYDHLEKRVDEVMEKDKMRAFQSPLRGDEIMKICSLKPGPTVGRIKTAIEEAILDGIIPNEYDAAKDYFNKIKDEFLGKVVSWEKVVDK
ncbi:MAG: tRNA nucleotidyltransferase [Candidatus Magasanikbacteria bacterium CG10_big_fil_rev_8_21_14_0_10_36_32]|uniref:tRNA nucleotidyltransferase n=1 Tax=Candidatus Magasanikbacteria bacterium CG10_big_fil_rev_8_21_14_0_10_36_32 TaxID=1974646 RepID=A0A2M6W5P1_9BACT|nr:MAG: tRNA nucleotidyltransferase [Candidatus Magasanikbacteria bacterium CG10_big_fil_rev_8_21_14_0_10_36_32]